MKFPVYRVEFTLNVGIKDVAACKQDMMLVAEFKDQDAMVESLWRVVQRLAQMLKLEETVTGWGGFVAFDHFDTWCYHYDSHYTYRRFESDEAALASFKEYINRRPSHEMQICHIMRAWHVCECDICKSLNRTMILHVEKEKCPTCSCVS